MRARGYQLEAHLAIKSALEVHRSTLLVLPTGGGKTIVFGHVAHEWDEGRVLVLAHTEELITQACDKIERITGDRPDREQAEHRALLRMWGGAKIIVGSVATLHRDSRLQGEVFRDPNAFGLVIIDEAHRAVRKNKMYRRIIEHFRQNPRCKILLVTATPDRSDGVGLHYAESLAYEYKLSRAIDEGYLVPIRQQYGVCVDIDFRNVRVKAGDFVEADLEAVMLQEKVLHEVAGAILERCVGQPTLVFAAGIHHAERLTEILKDRHGLKAVCIHGGNKDYPMPVEWRRKRIAEFNAGEHDILLGCDVFYEGFDSPRIANVVIAKKTRSRLRFAQAVGRGTRILDGVIERAGQPVVDDTPEARKAAIAASAKPFMTVVDLVGCSTELELDLPCVMDLLVDSANDAERRRAKRNAIERGFAADPDTELAEARKQLRDEREAKRRRAAVVADTRHEWTDVPAFGAKDLVASSGGERFQAEPTPKQIRMLRKHGIDTEGMTRGEAGRALDRLFKSFQGLAPTPRQQAFLDKRGMKAANFDHASVLIDLTVMRDWRPPNFPLTRDRLSIVEVGGEFLPCVTEPNGRKHDLVSKKCRTVDECREFLKRVVVTETPATATA